MLDATIARLADSDQARAFAAWARAAGDQVAAGARPTRYSRGLLTVECSSSVWANELTYLGAEILTRMAQVAPGHPVERFRFVVQTGPAWQEEEAPAAKQDERRDRPVGRDLQPARERAEGVRDERLRSAIEAALRASAGDSPEARGDSTPRG